MVGGARWLAASALGGHRAALDLASVAVAAVAVAVVVHRLSAAR